MLEETPQGVGVSPRRERPLEPGDAAPRLRLQDRGGDWVSPRDDGHAGQPAVIVFARLPEAAGLLEAFLKARHAGGSASRLFLAVQPAPPQPAPGPERAIWLADPGGEAAASYGFAGAPLASAVCDANGRILALLSGAPAEQAQAVAAALDSLAQPACIDGAPQHPPVLVLPRLLAPEHCDRLIAEWEKPVRLWPSDGFVSQGYETEASSFKLKVESHGELIQLVLRDPALERWLDTRFARRLRREILKAFQLKVPMREDYRVVCYDSAQGGHLGPHRDNPTEMTRHRLFTAVVALNDAEDYDGGELCFPEYAAEGYRLAKGAAVVWSASLLHEVRPVLAGRRYVLGTHLGR